MEPKEKLKRLGNLYVEVVCDGHIFQMSSFIDTIDSGVILYNECSMIDTFKIDNFDYGYVKPESINLDKMSGNKNVLDLIELMKSKKDCVFFPGTLLRNFGEYFLPTMPIIKNGEIIQERVKQTGIAYVDDYTLLAENLFGKDYAKKIENFKGIFLDEPMKSLQDKLEDELILKREGLSKTVEINGLNVFPLICNEISFVPSIYDGKLIDVVMHSSSSLNKSNEERILGYEKFSKEMQGRINLPLIIASSEGNSDVSSTVIFAYDGDKIQKLN